MSEPHFVDHIVSFRVVVSNVFLPFFVQVLKLLVIVSFQILVVLTMSEVHLV